MPFASPLTVISTFNTLLGFAQNVAGAVRSGSSLDSFVMNLLGFSDEGDGMSLKELSDEIKSQFDDVLSAIDSTALDQGLTHSLLALDMLANYNEDSSDYSRTDVIQASELGLTSVLQMAKVCSVMNDDPGTLIAQVAAVTQALTARMAVVHELQDGAWGKNGVRQDIAKAADFLEQAEDRYQAAMNDALTEAGITVGIKQYQGWSFHRGGNFNEFEVTITTGGLRIYESLEAKMDAWGNSASFTPDPDFRSVTGKDNGFSTFKIQAGDVIQIPTEEISNKLKLFFLHWDFSQDYISLDIQQDPLARIMLDLVLTDVVGEMVLEDLGFAIDVPDFSAIADEFAAFADGMSVVDMVEGRSSDGTTHEGKLAPELEGGDGRDFVNGKDFHDVLKGHGGDDLLEGGSGRDTLDGGAGADVLIGGTGSDGPGRDGDADVFVFRNPETPDTIKEFEARGLDAQTNVFGTMDTIRIDLEAFDADHLVESHTAGELAEDAFVLLSASTELTDETRVYQQGGALYFDADGTAGAYDPVHFATLVGTEDLTAANFEFV